jgi:hypothetical protein
MHQSLQQGCKRQHEKRCSRLSLCMLHAQPGIRFGLGQLTAASPRAAETAFADRGKRSLLLVAAACLLGCGLITLRVLLDVSSERSGEPTNIDSECLELSSLLPYRSVERPSISELPDRSGARPNIGSECQDSHVSEQALPVRPSVSQ